MGGGVPGAPPSMCLKTIFSPQRGSGELIRMSKLRALYLRFEHVLAFGKSPLLLIVRVYWGVQMAQSGWGKLHSLPRVTEYFASLNVPLASVQAPAIALLEFAGGIFLVLGLFTRLTAFLLFCDMVVAFLLADREALATAISSDPAKFYAAAPFTFLCATAVLMVFGAGAWAVDRYLFHRAESPRAAETSIP